MTAPRLTCDDDGTVRVSPGDAWWCLDCGRFLVLDEWGRCDACAAGAGGETVPCVDCGQRDVLDESARCGACAATARAEAVRIADVVMGDVDRAAAPASLRIQPGEPLAVAAAETRDAVGLCDAHFRWLEDYGDDCCAQRDPERSYHVLAAVSLACWLRCRGVRPGPQRLRHLPQRIRASVLP